MNSFLPTIRAVSAPLKLASDDPILKTKKPEQPSGFFHSLLPDLLPPKDLPKNKPLGYLQFLTAQRMQPRKHTDSRSM